MKDITKKAFDYFNDYSEKECDDIIGDKIFKKATEIICVSVRKRVKLEEEILYPAYEKEIK